MSGTHARIAYMKAPYSTEELQIIESMGFLLAKPYWLQKKL